MRQLGRILILTTLAVSLAASPAQADPGITDHKKVDVTFTDSTFGITCSLSDVTTSDNPPNDLTIYWPATVPPGAPFPCGNASARPNNSPRVSFNDSSGTALADRFNVTVFYSGISCTYEATFVTLYRQGTTRTYTNHIYYGLVSGSWPCPGNSDGDLTLTFR